MRTGERRQACRRGLAIAAAAFALLPNFAAAEDGLGQALDNLGQITERARVAEWADYGSDSAATAHMQCVVGRDEKSCSAIIKRQAGSAKASRWSLAVALHTRGEIREADGRLELALADYRAALALEDRPLSDGDVARVQEKLAQTTSDADAGWQSAVSTADTEDIEDEVTASIKAAAKPRTQAARVAKPQQSLSFSVHDGAQSRPQSPQAQSPSVSLVVADQQPVAAAAASAAATDVAGIGTGADVSDKLDIACEPAVPVAGESATAGVAVTCTVGGAQGIDVAEAVLAESVAVSPDTQEPPVETGTVSAPEPPTCSDCEPAEAAANVTTEAPGAALDVQAPHVPRETAAPAGSTTRSGVWRVILGLSSVAFLAFAAGWFMRRRGSNDQRTPADYASEAADHASRFATAGFTRAPLAHRPPPLRHQLPFPSALDEPAPRPSPSEPVAAPAASIPYGEELIMGKAPIEVPAIDAPDARANPTAQMPEPPPQRDDTLTPLAAAPPETSTAPDLRVEAVLPAAPELLPIDPEIDVPAAFVTRLSIIGSHTAAVPLELPPATATTSVAAASLKGLADRLLAAGASSGLLAAPESFSRQVARHVIDRLSIPIDSDGVAGEVRQAIFDASCQLAESEPYIRAIERMIPVSDPTDRLAIEHEIACLRDIDARTRSWCADLAAVWDQIMPPIDGVTVASGDAFPRRPAIEIIEDPIRRMKSVLRILREGPAASAGHFQGLRRTIERDFVETKQRFASGQATDAAGKADSALVLAILGRTPLADLLNAPLPLAPLELDAGGDQRFAHRSVAADSDADRAAVLSRLIGADLRSMPETGAAIIVLTSTRVEAQDVMRQVKAADVARTAMWAVGADAPGWQPLGSLQPFDTGPPSGDVVAQEARLSRSLDRLEFVFEPLFGQAFAREHGALIRQFYRFLLTLPEPGIGTMRRVLAGETVVDLDDLIDEHATRRVREMLSAPLQGGHETRVRAVLLRGIDALIADRGYDRVFGGPQPRLDLARICGPRTVVVASPASLMSGPTAASVAGRALLAAISALTADRTRTGASAHPLYVTIDDAGSYFANAEPQLDELLSSAGQGRLGLTIAHRGPGACPETLLTIIRGRTAQHINAAGRSTGGAGSVDDRQLRKLRPDQTETANEPGQRLRRLPLTHKVAAAE